MRRRLLCLDLDGTLLRPGGSIAATDLVALQRASRAGALITIATGRMVSGALPIARALGIALPIICADGSVLACASSGALLERWPIARATVRACLSTMVAHGLLPLLFLPGAIHGHAACRPLAPHLASWTPHMAFHAELDTRAPLDDVMLVLALGAQHATDAARDALTCDHGQVVEATSFPFGADLFAVRAQPRGCTKGTALARLAAHLAVAREDVAAVGDWWNDVSMLAWAGRSFAMAHAPEGVRAAATDTLGRSTGGGVAEAIERWLGAAP
jgi:Cof subfamily protein (haloacid dehalogenase superfamily)